jgi:peptidyl-prolyl cis-trans isomerase C
MVKIRSRLLLAAVVAMSTVAVPAARAADDAGGKSGDDGVVVAVVNGENIYRSDVADARYLLPQQFQQLPLDAVYGLLLNSLIDRKLTAAEARKEGLDQDEEVKRVMARVEEQVLQRAYLTHYIEKRIDDATMQKAYEDYAKDFERKKEVRARHILVDTEDQAKEVIAELDDGADFAELAKEKSKGPSGQNGGDLGYFAAEDMVPEFAEAAFALDVGSYTKEPVQTQFGWHVIKVEDSRTAEPPSFEEAEEDVRADVSREIGSKLMGELRAKADIERFNLDGTPMTDAPADGKAGR